MHKRFLFLVLALAALPSTRAFSQWRDQPGINVSGTAEVKVAPDEIYLKVGVETRDKQLDEARRLNDARVAQALAFLKTQAVEDKNIQTDFIGFEPVYDNDVSRTKPVVYIARKSIEVKLTKFEGFDGLLAGLLSSGITTVHGIEFRTSQLRKYRDEARAMAIRAAREKADAMAAELGVKRGKAYNVNVNDYGGWTGPASGWGNRSSGPTSQNIVQNAGGPSETGEESFAAGQISVSATVGVLFLIE